MRSKDDRTSTPSRLHNAFKAFFLALLDERDEPPAAAEADVAGPWFILAVAGRGFGLFREGEDPARGFHPYAVFPDRWLALIAAAVLPGTGRDPLLHLGPEPGPEGFPFLLDSGESVGHVQNFDQPLCDALHVALALHRSPRALADLLEAAGAITLERCGTILDARVAAEAAAGAP